jgi:hypothetical protein
LITYHPASGRFDPGPPTDPATIPGRRAVGNVTATLNELTALLGPPDTRDGRFPCWLVRYGDTGPFLSVYRLSLDALQEPDRLFEWGLGAARGVAETAADDLAGVISAALCAAERK